MYGTFIISLYLRRPSHLYLYLGSHTRSISIFGRFQNLYIYISYVHGGPYLGYLATRSRSHSSTRVGVRSSSAWSRPVSSLWVPLSTLQRYVIGFAACSTVEMRARPAAVRLAVHYARRNTAGGRLRRALAAVAQVLQAWGGACGLVWCGRGGQSKK